MKNRPRLSGADGTSLPESRRGRMAGKIEYRLDEYREFENGQWGPWRKLYGRLFDDDPSSVGLSSTKEDRIHDEWLWRKIDNKPAWTELKRERAAYWKIINRDDIHKPEQKHLLEYFTAKIDKIDGYVKEVEAEIKKEQENQVDGDGAKESPPDIILLLAEKKGWLKESTNGKFDIVGMTTVNFLRACALEDFLQSKKLTEEIIKQWINHNYTIKGKSNSLYKAVQKAKKETEEQNQEKDIDRLVDLRLAEKEKEAADSMDKATNARKELLKKAGFL
jgi:hypothetical protein